MNKGIDWEALRKRMLIMKFQPGYFASTPTPPLTGWILETGFWNDLGLWVDSENWVD